MSTLKTLSAQVNGSVRKFVNDEEGATAAEYGIIAALIAVVIITAVRTLGTQLSAMFNNLSQNIK